MDLGKEHLNRNFKDSTSQLGLNMIDIKATVKIGIKSLRS